MSKTKSRFHVTLKDPEQRAAPDGHALRVPCPKCENDPFARAASPQRPGTGQGVPGVRRVRRAATAESAVAFLEALEGVRRFRLDEPGRSAATTRSRRTRWRSSSRPACTSRRTRCSSTAGSSGPARSIPSAARPRGGLRSKSHKGWLAFHNCRRSRTRSCGSAATRRRWPSRAASSACRSRTCTPAANLWDWDTDTIKSALTTAYTVDIDTHDFFNDVTNEITGTNYTAGGFTLATATARRTTPRRIRSGSTRRTSRRRRRRSPFAAPSSTRARAPPRLPR
jgi:hypothetical protein